MTLSDDLRDITNKELEKKDAPDSLGSIYVEPSPQTRINIKIAKTICKTYAIKTIIETDEMMIYSEQDSGTYLPNADKLIPQLIKRQGLLLSRSDIAEIIFQIKADTYIRMDQVKGARDGYWFHVKNGWLNVITGELQNHTPDRISTGCINAIYDKDAQGPEGLKFLDSSLDEKEKRKLIKMLGDCLLPGYPYQSFYALWGAGQNGKGTFGRWIRALFGSKLCSSVRLQDLANDRFAAAQLHNKILNFGGDINDDEKNPKAGRVNDWALIRSLTGGDELTVQHKGLRHFVMTNEAKLIWAFNKLPEIDGDYASFRRLVLIHFDRIFEGENRDRDLDSKLAQPNELSALLNLALLGVQWLKEDDGYEESWVEVRAKYKEAQNEASAFVKTHFILDPTGQVESKVVQQLYDEWAEKEQKTKMDDARLGAKLADLDIQNKPRRLKGKLVHFYVGISLKDSSQQVLEDQ